jgi:Arc/MetJ-type ribon-helix-helix transcriptional regulator
MADTEKITINTSAVDLGRIDVLVESGYYSNRTDFVRTAIRKELDFHSDAIKETTARRMCALGVVVYTAKELERLAGSGEKVDIRVVGVVRLSDDIQPELARDTIQSLKVYGVLRASQAVKEALMDRMH